MAPAATKSREKVEIPWPKNLVIEGPMSFPLTSVADLDAIKDWRAKRKIAAPEYDDKIGVNILLTQEKYEKAVDYLENVYMPFTGIYHELTGKGVDPAAQADLLAQIKERKWTTLEGRKEKPNLPIRELTDSDRENIDTDLYTFKMKVSGPYEADFEKKAIIKNDQGRQVAVELSKIDLPTSRRDPNQLWWGSNWHFRVPMKMNAFERASLGITAYGSVLFLLPHLGLPISGGTDEAQVLEDGDDWE
jgi:hypothetical protein